MILHLPDKPQTFRPCVQLQFFQIWCCLRSSRKCGCDVLFFFLQGDASPSISLLSQHAACCSYKSICVYLLLWCSPSFTQVCFLSISLYSRYLWMWVWPLKGSFLNSVSWSSALLCSDVALSSLMRLNGVVSDISSKLPSENLRIESLVVIQ